MRTKTIDELIADKLLEMVHYILIKIVRPDMIIGKVSELDSEVIERLKKRYNIEGIILDVDETIRKEMKEIPKCNQKWIEDIKGKIKIIILSNGIDSEIERYFQEIGIDYIGFAQKPLKRNFLKACEKMDVTPDKVLVVGNSLISDIYGGKRINMKTILVKDVEDEQR